MIMHPQRHTDMGIFRQTDHQLLAGGRIGFEGEKTSAAVGVPEASTIMAIGSSLRSVGSVLLVGLTLGYITILPNAMMSDFGTEQAKRRASVGLAASALFVCGGVAGCILHSWKALLPGLVLQILTFIV